MRGSRTHDRFRRACGAATLLAMLVTSLPVMAQDPTDESYVQLVLTQAKVRFHLDEFQEALDSLATLDPQRIPDRHRFEYHLLRGRCLIGAGLASQGYDAFTAAHLLDRQWRPDRTEFSEAEIVIFNEAVLQNAEPEDRNLLKKSVLAACVGLAVYVLASRGDDASERSILPPFPEMPGDQ